ncbi:MAG: PepSY domain-containing protein [Sphingomonadales bacterium]|nr:PepSY domain-containing protein [Sphingomonadales bacterium]
MKSTALKLTTAAAIVALGAAVTANTAFAAGTSLAQAARQTPQAPGSGVTRPSTSFAEAVRSAERQTKGRAGKVELEREGGVYVYEVKTFSNEGPVKVSVDFATGKIGSVKSRGFLARIEDIFDSDDKREDEALFKALATSPVTLSQAIDAAESNTGGRAIKAKMKDRYGSMYYDVALIVEGSKKRVAVDSATAKVVAVKARKDDDDDDDDDKDD